MRTLLGLSSPGSGERSPTSPTATRLLHLAGMLCVSVACGNGDSPTQGTSAPAQSSAPNSGSTTAPNSGSTTTPYGGSSNAPNSGSTTTPNGGSTTAPNTVPNGGTTTAPPNGTPTAAMTANATTARTTATPPPSAKPQPPSPSPSSSATPGTTTSSPNLFTTLLGKTKAEVDAKLQTAVNRFFGIGTNEPTTLIVDSGYRCYYEFGSDMAFIWAADSNDIRSEGQSYGMMVAVQMDLHTEFDKLWKFAKTKMQFTTPPAWKSYFRWQGKQQGDDWVFPSTSPAPDGEEYFAAALYFADKRWGSAGSINYKQEADTLSAAMLHNVASGGNYPIINPTSNMVVFVPGGNLNNFSDPSYHLPAFYELFALYGPSADADKWRSVAKTSRSYLVASAHPSTGLHPDYATFDGKPTTASSGDGHDQFKYDALRVVMNMAMDVAWFSEDASLKQQVEKYHSFFSKYLTNGNVTASLFHVDGSNPTGGGSTALTATLAAGAMASDATNKTDYVRNLWNVEQQSGKYRYYQEGVYLLGLLNASGAYRFAW